MKTFKAQMAAFPVGCHVVVSEEFSGNSVGTTGFVDSHCDDGRAYFFIGRTKEAHTFSYENVSDIPLRRDYERELAELRETIALQTKWLEDANAAKWALDAKLKKLPSIAAQLSKLAQP